MRIETKVAWAWIAILTWIMLVVLGVVLMFFVPTRARASDLALGDSIALGTGHALGISTVARSGAGSCEVLRWAPRRPYTRMVISAGINDAGICVASLRLNVHARRITWIIPAAINGGSLAVWNVVKRYGDRWVIYTCPGGRCTRTNFHPASYPAVAASVRRVW